jgi:2-polyprenyl-6-methoxyphenol hydroxylase-like FAD-dependent oxidoreductase
MRVLIVGAGIGGLTTALSLHRAGIRDVTVLEAAPEVLPLGVGINLLPHAVRELTELGLGDALHDLGTATADLTYYDQFGSLIWREPRGTAAGYRWPQYSIHRGALQQLLLDRTVESLGPEAVLTDRRVVAAASDPAGANVTWSDGRHEVQESADVVVAADGIKSAVRAQRYPTEGPPQWNGSVLWRGISRIPGFLTGRSMIMAGHREQKFVAYPIKPARADGTQLVNWIAERTVDDRRAGQQDWNRAIDVDVFAGEFARWKFDWLDVPAVIAAAEAVFEYPMVDRPALDSWTDGRVTLLGDAAHPTYPIGSNGSSQAIIDARVLAYALATRDVDAALDFYQFERLPRTRELQRVNRAMGPERVMQLVHERAPGGFVDIDQVVPQLEREEIAASYKQVAGFDPVELNDRESWSVSTEGPTP